MLTGVDRREELLAAVLASPTRAACAVYGDHLQQLGDPRGDLVNLEVRLADRLPAGEHRRLRQRRDELLDAHAAQWWPWIHARRRSATQGIEVATRFGFLTHAWLEHGPWMKLDPRLVLELEPILELHAGHATPATLAYLQAAPWLSRLRRLELWADGQPLAPLLASPRLAGLRALDVPGLDAAALPALAEGLPGLRELRAPGHGDATIDALLARPTRRLVRVSLGGGITLDGLTRFLAGGWEQLQHLGLFGSSLDDAGAFALAAAADRLPALRSIDLSHVSVTAAGARALAGAPWAKTLRSGRVYAGTLQPYQRFGAFIYY
jgi:hypothetical protein